MKIRTIGFILAILAIMATALYGVNCSLKGMSENSANIHHIGRVNGNGSIIAVVEFEGKRYLTSTAGGFIEIK